MKSKTKLLSLASIAALGLASCANDELQEAYQGEEIGFTTRVSRATETRLDNLDGFYVYADAVGYPKLYIDGVKATKNKTVGNAAYDLENKFIWPMDVNTIRFWAYGPTDIKDLPAFEPVFTPTSQALKDFKVETDIKNAGKYHKDLVVAYTEATRESATGMRVSLNFHHALSQIAIRIKKGAGFESGRVVKIKGAWLMNVHSKGSLAFSNDPQFDNHMSWSTSTPLANYGRELEKPSDLQNPAGITVISNESGGNETSLMVLPQTFVKYNFEESAAKLENPVATNISNYNTSGTYIMVLCRVETKHDFPATGTESDAIGNYNGYHVHQLFPITKDSSGNLVYNEEAYGYTCVPISGTWEPGKKYIYTLEFCGKDSGAGVYPPDSNPEGFPPGTDRPEDKDPGDPVLENPISFSVTVSDWEGNELSTPMN